MNPRRARLRWALAATGAVAAVALALRVVGVADNVEFIATLLVAPVIAATLLVDRNLGYVAAGVAGVAYLYLRFDDIQNAGAVGVVILVVFRAANYGGVAYVTPLLFARLSGVSDVDIGVPARHLRAEPVDPGAPRLGSDEWIGSGDRWAAEPSSASAVDYGPEPLDDAYADAETYADAYGETYADASVAAVAEAPRSRWADEAPDAWAPDRAAGPLPPPVPAGFGGRQDQPPAPRLPTGWIDDATSPLGDETIPVGYTGELFLGRITGSVPVVPANGARNGSGTGAGHGGSVTSSPMSSSPGANGTTARPGYADTEPLRPLEPAGPVDLGMVSGRPAETDWSSRAGGGVDRRPALSGEHPAPWTARADEAWDTTPPRGGTWVDPRPSGATPAVGGSGGGAWGDPRPSGATPAVGGGAWGDPRPSGATPAVGGGAWGDPRPSGATPAVSFPPAAPSYGGPAPEPSPPAPDPSAGVDAETRLWNAPFFRDRLNSAIAHSQATASPFSVVMIQVPDEPFQPLPYRRQVALLRELGHQFVPRFVDHLVHLPDGVQHWFAVVLDDTDSTVARSFERRLRTTLAGYLRSRGLRVGELQSASLTSPDDDEAMATIWASLLGADNVDA